MGESQLKRLKRSLREQGVIGPQQSKKQKRKNAQDERVRDEKRLRRTEALTNIREQFNPFDLKHNVRGPKFAVTTNRPASKAAANGVNGRPAASRSLSEQRRRDTLLVEMQHRNKVGGILDKRFGENDPNMALEDKMLERFAREKQRSHRKGAMFDLEDDGPDEELTHQGKSLVFDKPQLVDDFDEDDVEDGDASSGDEQKKLKRDKHVAAASGEFEGEFDENQPERKRTKNEVMKEVIAKSKLHKYERQTAKEQDDDLRAELDKGLPGLRALLMPGGGSSSSKAPATTQGSETAAATISGLDKSGFEREYDLQVKQLAREKRAQPTEKTKTEEEKAEEASARLKELEEQRLKRMRGEVIFEYEEDDEANGVTAQEEHEEDTAFTQENEAEGFGLGKGIKMRPTATQLGFDDEDDFLIEDELIASGSDLEPLDSDESEEEHGDTDDEEDEFTMGLVSEAEAKLLTLSSESRPLGDAANDGLPFTFSCPQTITEFLELSDRYPHDKLPTIVQRIRALHHPRLDSKNKEKLANFSKVLVDFIARNMAKSGAIPSVTDSLIRHLHSLAKSYPIDVANQFRQHVEVISRSRPLSPDCGDLVLLTAIGSIFPTSDHFHQVVTPAMLTIARFLGQKVPASLADFSTGTYLSILAIQYQQFAKRYVPEVMNFCLNALCALAPTPSKAKLGDFPIHDAGPNIRVRGAKDSRVSKLSFGDCRHSGEVMTSSTSLKVSLVDTIVQVLQAAADLWSDKPSFYETFDPAVRTLKHLAANSCRSHLPESVNKSVSKAVTKLEQYLRIARLARRPLELHHHRPLAIKTSVPKFEDAFDPHKHYDPDRDRAELAKLRAEHKKERKGAMRELRKDANFMAREKLRIKKAKDEAYEKKFKRLVAEIQSEEGREANAYEREKEARKRQRNR